MTNNTLYIMYLLIFSLLFNIAYAITNLAIYLLS
jgi:hypothetical protein